MDTSETYIKMCEKAEEIQSLRVTPVVFKLDSPNITIMGDDVFHIVWGTINNLQIHGRVWLPRQDQLQEILGVKLPANALFAISEWCKKMNYLEHQKIGETIASSCPFFSMEKLWLAFCMSEKYNKTWDGEEWK